MKITIFFTQIVCRVLEFFCLQYVHKLYVVLISKKKYFLNNQVLFEYSVLLDIMLCHWVVPDISRRRRAVIFKGQ